MKNCWFLYTAQKMKFSIKDFFNKCNQIRRNLVTFIEEIPTGKLLFLCNVISKKTKLFNFTCKDPYQKNLYYIRFCTGFWDWPLENMLEIKSLWILIFFVVRKKKFSLSFKRLSQVFCCAQVILIRNKETTSRRCST